MIDRPFIGESVIRETKLLDIYGDTMPGAQPAAPLSTVSMSGRVSVPQSCQLAPGQVTTIEFDNLHPDTLSTPGAATPNNTRQRTFQIQCTNISETVAINLSLESAAHPRFPDVFATHRRTDVGIQVSNHGRIVPPLAEGAAPTPAQIIPLTLDYAAQRAEFTIEAYPVRTEKHLVPGPFEGAATLKFEFE
ncbi:fimbrial protein [Pseudomonas resinovorans]|uniref:Fimbrial protein n=1 Tax=Metapseudomonas resinovorans TaxID=53412 RepID=A0ABT4YBN5_METRE|nr:fimbrial protein [Pseudomonas resinovorans]MDA8486297.1 fimbrial protein [Pseudomonas resinovorans]